MMEESGPRRDWWHRSLEPEERRRVMLEVALVHRDGWTFRFVTMLTLSAVVAAMGLSANSAAVVIGAMLLAPLMNPVLGLAAALSMALFHKVWLSAFRVAAATAWCILITYAISAVLPDGPLSAEVVARTSPDLRDLVVAFAAGLAGAYATVRADTSSALPGVAVAVALVPPLAAIGITLEAGRTDLAAGALLLYGTNLAAIVAVGVAVFLVTGFVPPRRLIHASPGVIGGVVAVSAVVIAVAIPLMQTSVSAARTAQLQSSVDQAVSRWLVGYEDSNVEAVDVEDKRVTVEVSGPERPPEQELLEELLVGVLGADVKANVSWTRTERVTTTVPASTTSTTVSPLEERQQAVQAVVEEWLTAAGTSDDDYELEALVLTADDRLRVDVVGIGGAPPVDELNDRLASEFGPGLTVTLTWVPRSVVAPAPPPTVDPHSPSTEMVAVITAFARDAGVEVDTIDLDVHRLRVELAGPTAPDVTDLEVQLLELLAPDRSDTDVEIYFTSRVRLGGGPTTTVG